VAAMLTLYVVLDGFDLGVGAIHLFVARTDAERRLSIASIGPVWDGNEVWLVAAGGTLFMAFPHLYAESFSGFYLPLMIVLWLLILRGLAIELRSHVPSPLWRSFWDSGFSLASAVLVVFLGIALGNVIRGVSFDMEGRFFTPLWTHFRVAPEPGVIDWFTTLVGLLALVALVQHGALWLVLKTDGKVRERAAAIARRAWLAAGIVTPVVTAVTWAIQPVIRGRFQGTSWGWLFPLLIVGSWWALRSCARSGRDEFAFAESCVYLIGMLGSVALGLYPNLLPDLADTGAGLTISNSAAEHYSLAVALRWWVPGVALALIYMVFAYRHLTDKVRLDEGEGEGEG